MSSSACLTLTSTSCGTRFGHSHVKENWHDGDGCRRSDVGGCLSTQYLDCHETCELHAGVRRYPPCQIQALRSVRAGIPRGLPEAMMQMTQMSATKLVQLRTK